MNEAFELAKKLFKQGYSVDKIAQITGLNQTWLELKLGNRNL